MSAFPMSASLVVLLIVAAITSASAVSCSTTATSLNDLCSFGTYCANAVSGSTTGTCTALPSTFISVSGKTVGTACGPSDLPVDAIGTYYWFNDPTCTQTYDISSTGPINCADGQSPSTPTIVSGGVLSGTTSYICATCSANDLCDRTANLDWYCKPLTSVTFPSLTPTFGTCHSYFPPTNCGGAGGCNPSAIHIGTYTCIDSSNNVVTATGTPGLCYQTTTLNVNHDNCGSGLGAPYCLYGGTVNHEGAGGAGSGICDAANPPNNWHCFTSTIVGDPQFTGFRGQSYQVHGIDGAIYNLITHPTMQLNTRFGFLSSGKCPKVLSARPTSVCWSHPGSYITGMGLQQWIDGKLIKVLLISGPADSGYESVQLNGKQLTIGSNTTITSADGHVSFAMSYVNSHYVTIHTPFFDYEFENSDRFVNQNVVNKIPLARLNTHGLLGQTWQSKIFDSALKYVEGSVDDYALLDEDMFGTNFVFNEFSASSA